MDRRQIIALMSLGIVGAGVGGLVLTSGDDDSAAAPDPVAPNDSWSSAASSSESAQASDQAPDVSASESAEPAEPAEPPTTVDPNVPDLPNRGPHPEFIPAQEWIQTDVTDFAAFDGKVRAVQFWTFGCHNCQATWPHMRDLHTKYAGDDFEIIGVHAPEFSFEDDVEAVRNAAEENGLVWPIAIENIDTKPNFRSWQERRFWPRLFLIDHEGNVRYDKIGEGKYDEIDAAVGALIAERQA